MTYANMSTSCLPYMTPIHMCLCVYSDEAPKRPKKAGEEREGIKTTLAMDFRSLLQITGQATKDRTNWQD